MSNTRQFSDVGRNLGRVVGGLLLARRNRGHDYHGHYSDHYGHLGGHFSLHGSAGLGHIGHHFTNYGHHRYYRSYYSPVYYPAYYREPSYYRIYSYDNYGNDYPDTYNSNTTVYIGDASGSYESDCDTRSGNSATVIVEPNYVDAADAPGSVVDQDRGELPRDGRQGRVNEVENGSQASIPPSAALIEQGNKAFSDGSYGQAQDLYLQAVLTDDRDGYAKLFLGLASFAQGDFDMAALGFRQAMLSTDELLAQPIDLRQFYSVPTDLEKQLDRLERLVIREPAHRDARFLLGYIYFSIGQSEKALTVLTTLTDLYPADELAAALRNSVDRIVVGAKATTTPSKENQRP